MIDQGNTGYAAIRQFNSVISPNIKFATRQNFISFRLPGRFGPCWDAWKFLQTI